MIGISDILQRITSKRKKDKTTDENIYKNRRQGKDFTF